jgi:hypothetical protein
MKKLVIVYLVLTVLALIGEVKCIIKAFKCNWEPVGKAEIIYTGSAVTGLGCITGWINIEDK